MNQQYAGGDLKGDGVIILDNGSTTGLFHDAKLLDSVRVAKEGINIATNGGVLSTNLKGNVPGYGDVWYDPRAIANIFSLFEMIKLYRVTFDSWKENAFLVHKKDGIAKFVCNDHGLYVFKVSRDYRDTKEELSHLVDTVAENRKGYT